MAALRRAAIDRLHIQGRLKKRESGASPQAP